MLANSRLSCLAACIRLAHMRTHTTIGGSELLLSVIAIRLAVLVLVGFALTLLPRQARQGEAACSASYLAWNQPQPAKTVSPHVANTELDDMRLHD